MKAPCDFQIRVITIAGISTVHAGRLRNRAGNLASREKDASRKWLSLPLSAWVRSCSSGGLGKSRQTLADSRRNRYVLILFCFRPTTVDVLLEVDIPLRHAYGQPRTQLVLCRRRGWTSLHHSRFLQRRARCGLVTDVLHRSPLQPRQFSLAGYAVRTVDLANLAGREPHN